LAILAICLTSGLARAQDQLPSCYVLSVGIDSYQNAGKLQGCVNDARNASQTFRQQEGTLFDKVQCTMLIDAQASRQRIEEEMKTLATAGKAGDVVVLFLSGHGDRRGKAWAFLAQDFGAQQYAGTTISDASILQLADALATAGKKVCIIVDACFAGQLRLNARNLLARFRDPAQGGIILMVSSMPNQTSAACGAFSAFAFAVKEGMDGKADYNTDGRITLQELRRYVYHRVYELQPGDQDGEIDYSLSLSDATVVARKVGGNQAAANPPAQPTNDRPANNQANDANVIRGKLTAQDPLDKIRVGSRAKVYTARLAPGYHVIDLTSGSGVAGAENPGFFDTYLRIHDAQGNLVAENDDHGGTYNSRATFQIARPGEFVIVVTSFAPGATGDFELRIR
jgi:hypothetical protein